MQPIRIVLAAALALVFATSAAALDRVVDPSYGSSTPGWGSTAFATIATAVAAASQGDTITLNAGTYSGPSNKNVTVNVRLTIRAAAGAASPIIDLELSGRAFLFRNGATNSWLEGVTIQNGRITDTGFPDGYGGAIRTDAANLSVVDCVFTNNRSGGSGGAIAVVRDVAQSLPGGTLTVRGTRFTNNRADGFSGGGALALTSGGPNTIDSSVFEGNRTPDGSGGAILSLAVATNVRSCLFSGNSATFGRGGAIFYEAIDDTGRVVNGTFVNNDANYGGGLAVRASGGFTVSVSNSIFWGNTASIDGDQVRAEQASSSGLTVPIDYSIFEGGSAGVSTLGGATATYGANNLPSDPQFVSGTDFHLGETSPARDSGTASPPGGLTAEDADGQPRVQNVVVDRGALEYPALPLIALSPATFQLYALEGGPNPAAPILSISNSGVGTLDWTVSESCSWLTPIPAAGDTTSETDDVTLQVEVAGLLAGPYTCDLSVTDPGAGNSPQVARVDLTVGNLIVVPDDFPSIQGAVDAAASGDHILLRDGTYSGAGNVDVVVDKVLAIRSENGPSSTIVDCEGSGRAFSFLTAASRGSVLEGVTIRNGNSTGAEPSGGAVVLDETAVTLRDCEFLDNRADGYGGAVFADFSELVVEGCLFRGNQAQVTGALHVGGDNTGFTVLDSVFEANTATFLGAGGAQFGTSGSVRRCVFAGNTTAFHGGGMYLGSGAVEVSDSLFAGNHADLSGGALRLFSLGDQPVKLVNSTLVDNTVGPTGSGGGISYQYAGAASTTLSLYNDILWGNTVEGVPDQIHVADPGADLVVDYSDVQGGEAGVAAVGGATSTYGANNLDTDPLFTSAAVYTLQEASACRDAGTSDPGVLGAPLSATDLAGKPRVVGAEVDMGAYEYSAPTTPLIGLSQQRFDYTVLEGDPNPPDRTLSITNTGIGTLDWTLGVSCTWLQVLPASGDTTSESDDVSLRVDLAGLTHGQYDCSVTVSDPAAENDPQMVDVSLAVGAIVLVPDAFPTIQAAIDGAGAGDVVVVRDGVWKGAGNVDLDFGGKAITVRSQNGPAVTVIDGEGAARGFVFDSGETAASVVAGFTIRNGRITGNGGAIHVGVLSSPTIEDCIFENNTALVDPADSDNPPSTGNGGAVYLGAFSRAQLRGCEFLDNTAHRNGGGLYLDYAGAHIVDGIFAGNTALYTTPDGGMGGALFGYEADGAAVERTVFRSNTSIRAGGAVYLDSTGNPIGRTTITECTFDSNSSIDGGALANAGGLTVALSSSFFHANAASRDGGALFIARDVGAPVAFDLTSCTFSANAAEGDGGAVWNGPHTTLNVSNSIFWGNAAAGDGSQIRNGSFLPDDVPGGARLAIGYVDIEGGLDGVANVDLGKVELQGPVLDADPQLLLPDDPHLVAESPCIDAGTNTPAAGLPERDLDGGARVLPPGGRVDMGASEYDPSATELGIAVTPKAVDLTLSSANIGPVDVTLSLRSRSTASVAWQVVATCGWATSDPASGESSGEIDEVTVTVDASGLGAGTHRCSIVVANSGGAAATVTIPLTVRVTREIIVSVYFDDARDDFATIQEGIDAAVDGDTVVVRAGTYTGAGNVDLDYHGKSITVRAESGADYTVIDCEGSARGVWFHNGEGPAAALEGFTIRNGSTTGDGGGILVEASSPAIRGCVLEGNHADGFGGGLQVSASVQPVTVADTAFSDNDATLNGGAVHADGAELSITRSTFESNRAAYGGAISSNASKVTISQSTIAGNTAQIEGGGFFGSVFGSSTAELRLTNSLFHGNQATDGGGLYLISGAGSDAAEYSSAIVNSTFHGNRANASSGRGGGLLFHRNNAVRSVHTVTNCLLYGNTAASGADVYALNDPYVDMDSCLVTSAASNGNQGANSSNIDEIQGNPWFRDAQSGDFRLLEFSPAIDAGRTVDGVYSDLRGSLRPLDGDDDGVSSFDIGAYEFSRFFGGGSDEVTQPFQTLEINGRRVVIGYEYKILWKDLQPFPDSDPRVRESGRYEVRIALEDEGGRRMELTTTTKALQLLDVVYAVPFTFGPEHIGTWHLVLEMADDPGQFVRSADPVTVEYLEVTDFTIGGDIPAPAEALPGLPPEIEDDALCYWSEYDQKLYAVAPGVTMVTWYADEAKQYPIPVLVGNEWPSDPRIHVVGTPPTELLPDGSPYNSVTLEYSGIGAGLSGSTFSVPEETYSVLHFYHSDAEVEKFLVVRSLYWDHADLPDDPNDPAFPSEDTWNVGDIVAAPPQHEPACGGGYVVDLPAPYDGYGEDPAYDAASREGPIIPVNLDAESAADDLVVVWYEQDGDGVCWPDHPLRYDPRWPDDPRDPADPADADRPVTDPADMKTIVIDTSEGSGPLDPETYGESQFLRVYRQPDPEQAGFNPNEEHALIETPATSNDGVLYALRNDLNRPETSRPYALLKYRDPATNEWAIEVFKVLANVDTQAPDYVPFLGSSESGSRLQPPHPLPRLITAPCESTAPTLASGPTHRDKNGELYALEPVPGSPAVIRFAYPLQPSFDYDRDGDGGQDETPGSCIPWELVFDGAAAAAPVDVSFEVSWPADTPDLQVGETLLAAKHGLPEISDQCSVKLLYGEDRARLIDPLGPYSAPLDELPPEVVFEDLPFHLSSRVDYDAAAAALTFEGSYDDSVAGEPLLLLNIMSQEDREGLRGLSLDGDYRAAVDALYAAGRATLASQPNQPELVTGTARAKALPAGAASSTGDTLVAFNDNEACSGPVDLVALGVECPLYRGDIKVIEPADVFDNRVTLRHSGDFGGEPEAVLFEWRWWEDRDDRPADPAQWKTWFSDPADGQGTPEILIEGDGEVTLADKWFVVRYQMAGASCASSWSEWTEPQLYQGWVKRVLSAINLFDQRFDDFRENGANTVASMIQQAGERYEGAAALNYDPDNLDSLGLIQFYQTVLDQARELTIDAVPPSWSEASNQQILLAASRLADLHMLLGNEGYADALDPTIGFGTDDGEYGTAASSMFSFQNQVGSLLEEELALLRGRDDEGVRPFYNRLVWNFTQSEGEVAYRQTYDIFDWNGDGFIDEYDARAYYPQGHGDAWGHYLSASKVYYDLLRHPNYEWKPRAESLLVAGTPVEVDYEDERRFARVAAAKARAGVDVIDLTLRQRYEQSPEAHLGGYADSNPERAWGVEDWASRVGQGAYFDWVVGNSLIPALDEAHEGIERVDRVTVAGLREIPALYGQVQAVVDKAGRGLNPLGLAKEVVPFDFEPTFYEVGSDIQGDTHFEQMLTRAVDALNNAVTVFDHASRNTELLRRQQDSLWDFQVAVRLREQEYTNRLIEIYGYPYADDCGPGGTYPPDYCAAAPDLYHYMYVDGTELTGMVPTKRPFTAEVDIMDMGVDRFDAYRVFSSAEGVWYPDSPLYEWTPWVSRVLFELPATDGTLGFMTTPADWGGRRKAPGRIQMTLSDLLQARAAYVKATEEYRALIGEIEDNVALIQTQWNVGARELELLNAEKTLIRTLNDQILLAHGFSVGFAATAEFSYDLGDALADAIPEEWTNIPGTTVAKAAIKITGSTLKYLFNVVAGLLQVSELMAEQDKETVSLAVNINQTVLQNRFALKQQLLELENLIRGEIALRIEIFTLAEAMDQARGQYDATVAEGERLLNERYVFRTLTAADVQEYRYQDMAFRIFRNDALSRYRAQFDLAALYAFLAAKVYDYETVLLDSDSRAGKAFLGEIVRARTIGQMQDGEPLTGRGLSDVLKRLRLNFQVFKPRMGINNPQYEDNRFSLRRELFRLLPGEGSDQSWREILEAHRVEDLWQLPEFRRYCRPFAAEGVPQPGIVIPFETKVTAGQNFFGWPLGAGDSYYSTANFATKIRSTGVWFSDYEGAGLALTPRVYLVPVGADVQRAPSSDFGALRTWQVVDQRIPLPFPVDAGELDNDPGWIPAVDTLPGDLFDIRRHSDLRAYHDSGYLDGSEMVYDGRLMGRSAWNNRWLLIIPGQNLLHDPAEGIARLISGPEFIEGSGERSGEGVGDIKIYFQTYSYPGD